MKISKYTFFFNIDGKEYYTYNTLSNSLLEIDEESYSIFQNHKTGIQELSSEKVDKELWDVLCENNILTYIIHSGFISGYQNRYGDNLKPPTNVYHRMTA